MTQATQLPFPSFPEEEKIELLNEPRFLFIRASLDIATHQDNELRRLVNSNDPTDACQAMAILQAEANGMPEKELISPCWDHQNASYQLLHTEAASDAYSCSEGFCSDAYATPTRIFLFRLLLLFLCAQKTNFRLPPKCLRPLSTNFGASP